MTKAAFYFIATLALAVASGQTARPPQPDFNTVEIHTLPVQGNVYMLVGGGGNVTVQAGKDGVLLVDTNFAELAPKIIVAIRKLSDGPIRYVVNTHVHPDHTGGKEARGTLGAPPAAPAPALVVANLAVLERMVTPPGGAAPMARGLWP